MTTPSSEPRKGGEVGAVLVAAGAGRRFGAKKQFLELAGKPLVLHGVETILAVDVVSELVVVSWAAIIRKIM